MIGTQPSSSSRVERAGGRAGTGGGRRSRAGRAAPAPAPARAAPSAASQLRISRGWPAADERLQRAACRSGAGRSPSAATPAATAPDDTTTHLVAGGAQRGDLAAELGDRRVVDGAAFVGDRRRPDLDDDAHRQVRLVLEAEVADPHDVAVRGAGPGEQLVDAEPVEAVARCRRAPRACVTSLSATTRSTSRPTRRNSCVADALDGGAGRLGPQQHDALRSGSACAGLVDERAPSPRRARARRRR